MTGRLLSSRLSSRVALAFSESGTEPADPFTGQSQETTHLLIRWVGQPVAPSRLEGRCEGGPGVVEGVEHRRVGDERLGRPNEGVKPAGGDLDAEARGGHVLKFVRLVEDDDVVRRNDVAA